MLTILVMDFEFALAWCLQKFDRIIVKYTVPMVQMLVFLNVGGNINLCGNLSGRRMKAPMETVLGLINP